jgi:hypothetical protein
MEDDEYELIKNKTNLTYIDKNRLKKKKFRVTYNYKKDITLEIYNKYSKKYNQYNNLNLCYTLKDDLIKYLKNKIEITENQKIEKNELVEMDQTNEKFKLLTANTFILHQSKKNEKILICLELIKIIGINNIFSNNIFKIDFDTIYNYIKKREYKIRLLFKCKQLDINMIYNDEKGKHEMLKYINSRLRGLFNIYIKKVNKNDEYKIENMDFWNDDINPFRENEDIKLDLYLSTIIGNINLDENII